MDEAGTEEFTFGSPLTQNTTVYAKWAPAENSYTVIVWKQRASDKVDALGEDKYEDWLTAYKAANPGATEEQTTAAWDAVRKHYDYDSSAVIDTKANGEKVMTGDYIILDPSYTTIYGADGTSTHKDKSFFYYNQDETTQYVVVKASGGSGVTEQTLKYGEKPTKPDDPTREGFHFDGWFSDAELKTPFDFDKPIEGETPIYAKWTPNDYRVVSLTGVSADADHNWTKGSGVDVTATVKLAAAPDDSFAHYVRTEIDGISVPADAVEGSTVVTIKAATLQTLSKGVHTVTVRFDNGQAEFQMTVKPDPRSPGIGDERPTALWAALTVFAAAGLCCAVLLGKKRRYDPKH